MYICLLCAHTCHSISVEFRGQFSGIHSFFPPQGTQKLNSGRQPWRQVLLPTEPSYQHCTWCLMQSGPVLSGEMSDHPCWHHRTKQKNLKISLLFLQNEVQLFQDGLLGESTHDLRKG